MKKLATTLTIIILLAVATSSLFSANANNTAVLRLTAYIAEKTTITANDDGFIITSNTDNFSYSVQENANARMLFVVAN
ncbi:hypothetical protein [Sphaerochaeta sp. PS]|uniref:hypothetical protein n=1 Tax=Sphaerochaeta sp. PS TaxID=3076336 RepID=UPI0028A3D0F2|nr:hypothetical protein [Sphaerochaeta sp. PS]MDT4762059.1 hypothetical protein [Sphaerochaeta sp. PS]